MNYIKNHLGKIGYAMTTAGGVTFALGVTAPVGIILCGLGTILTHFAPSPLKPKE